MTGQNKTRDLHSTASLWRSAGGWTCLLIGVLGFALPMIPGIPLLVIGLLALSPNYPRARSRLRRVRERIRKVTCGKNSGIPETMWFKLIAVSTKEKFK